MKCVSFRWIDPEWNIRTLKGLKKLMESKRGSKIVERSMYNC
jgi:hypothetical protein